MSVLIKKIHPDNEIDKILYDKFTNNYRKGWIEVGEEKICMPEYYETIANEIENFEVRDTDIFLTTHPKTGTTWAQEMIWMIVNKLDFEEAQINLYERTPFLEYQGLLDYRDEEFAEFRKNAPNFLMNSLDLTRNCTKNPRIIKTHMPFSLLPKQIRNKTRKPKIIQVIRNAKDTCVSYYYHCRLLEGYKGNVEEFSKLFMAGRLSWGPFWTNVLGYWNKRQDYNILVIKFEDMKKDLKSVIIQVAEYLDRSLSEEQIIKLEDHLSFDNMKKNKSVNLETQCEFAKKINNIDGSFIRSGTVGGYREDMSQGTIKKFDEWINKATAGTGLNYDKY